MLTKTISHLHRANPSPNEGERKMDSTHITEITSTREGEIRVSRLSGRGEFHLFLNSFSAAAAVAVFLSDVVFSVAVTATATATTTAVVGGASCAKKRRGRGPVGRGGLTLTASTLTRNTLHTNRS